LIAHVSLEGGLVMYTRKRMTAGVISLSFALLALAAVRADDDIFVPKKTQATVNKMADNIAKGNKVDKDADAFFKENKDDLKKTMWVFKLRETGGKGGLGIGAKPGAYGPDGIDAFIVSQTATNPKRKLNLKNDAADLNRLADITLAMSEIAGKFVPGKAMGDQTPTEWNASNQDMKKAALLLKDAVKANNNNDVKTAFKALAASCNRCHKTFRD
jgi:hypothetical protein